MKICPFYDPMRHTPHKLLHGNIIHLHVHCSNAHHTHIRDQSNTDISTALYHLGILVTHLQYPHNLGCDPFRTFLCHLLHQYDDNTSLSSDIPDQDIEPQPYHHFTVAQRTHRNITTCSIAWHHLRPMMIPVCSDYLAYSHGLVSSLPPANYSRVSMDLLTTPTLGFYRNPHTQQSADISVLLASNNNVPMTITFPDQLQLPAL